MTDDRILDEADPEEARAAEALRQALDGGSGGAHLPDTALQTAALLRFSAQGGQLNAERRAQIRQELLAALPKAESRRSGWGRWLGVWLPLACGAAAVIALSIRGVAPTSETAAVGAAPTELARMGERAEVAAAPPAAAAPSDLAEASEEGEEMVAASQAKSGAAARPGLADLKAKSELGAATGLGELAVASRGAESEALAHAARKPVRSLGLKDDDDSQPSTPRRAPAKVQDVAVAAREYRAKLLPTLGDSRIEQAHAEADAARSRDELRNAERNLTQIVQASVDTEWGSAQTRLVRQDLFCRLAETALRLGQPETALQWTRQGLDLDGPPTPFLAQLSALEGQARDALGDRDGAAKSYMKALEVNEALLDESLDGH